MFQVEILLLLGLIALLVWLWSDGQRAREAAVRVCERVCQDLNLQFLDQTVALSRLGVARNRRGRLQIQRRFRFEFSTNGADRCLGHATVLGWRVEAVQLEHPAGPTLITPQPAGVHRLH